jgi:hypothetical protein
VDWARFRRRNVSVELVLRDSATGAPLRLVAPHETTPAGSPPVVQLRGCAAAAFACADDAQAVAYLLRADQLDRHRRVRTDVPARLVTLELPGLSAGAYAITEWDTVRGVASRTRMHEHPGGTLVVADVPLVADVAIVATRTG